MNTDHLQNKIKQIRKSKGFSQEVLADHSNLSLRTIQRIENGETIPRGDTLNRLADAFGITAQELTSDKKTKDQTFIALLNFSALSFLAFPPFGIVVPLLFWTWKRDKIQQLDEIGKIIVNFQITLFLILPIVFFAIIFLLVTLEVILQILLENYHELRNGSILIYTILFYILFNLYSIFRNNLRIQNGKPVKYWPVIRFLK